jgi:esterase/lipase
MDLMDLKPTSNTVEVKLKHPNTGVVLKNDDKTDMTIVVYASHSKEYKELIHEQTNKRLKVMQSSKNTNVTSQDMEKATLDMLSKITCGWNITYNKEQPKLSIAKAKQLYDEVFWIKDQIEEALADSLDFTKA